MILLKTEEIKRAHFHIVLRCFGHHGEDGTVGLTYHRGGQEVERRDGAGVR